MANIVNQYGQVKVGIRVASGGGGAIDEDAQAFITAAAITDTTQQSAINTLVTQLKTYGIWTKLKAVYPFVGGSASSHKFNLKDPRDLDAAYRLVFSGGWTHSSTGAKPNGTTGYADTKLNDNATLSLNSAHIATYLRTNIDGSHCDIGLSTVNSDISLFSKFSNIFYPRIHNINNGISNSISSLGLFISNRVNSTEVRAFQNNTLKLITNNSVAKENGNLYIGAMNRPLATTSFYSPRESAFATIGDGLTDTEAANFYTAVQTFQTTLGRQVGVPIVADADAQAFLNAAVITDQTQASAITTLVTDLKSANIWSKMKAIYPFVGGTALSHKFNLKDPRDLDAAYRLTFNGGWTHSTTGALPNGTNAYADTKLHALNTLTNNNYSLSHYSRTQSTSRQEQDLVSIANVYNYEIALSHYYSGYGKFFIAGDYVTNIAISNDTNTKGLLIGSRTSNVLAKLHFNGVIKTTLTTTNTNPLPNANFRLSANPNNVEYSLRESAFASIGDGLSDAEAAAFYTAVQKYQTTLGRQV